MKSIKAGSGFLPRTCFFKRLPKELLRLSKKIDYKKDDKHLYLPKAVPEIVDVPKIPFFMVNGSGDPNGEEFAKATEALYSLSYAVRMFYKSDDVPAGYYEYTVFPLEGVWDLLDYSKPAADKSNFKYTIMIRQPDFVTKETFERFLEQTKKKKQNPYLDHVRFEQVEEGLCCQMMHLGSFDNEPESFARMGQAWFSFSCRTPHYDGIFHLTPRHFLGKSKI
jgi:hypothetical protein